MDFFSTGPLATTVFVVVCWAELVVILWMIYVHNHNKKLENSIEEFLKLLKDSYILSLEKEKAEKLIKDSIGFLEKNSQVKIICEEEIAKNMKDIVDKLIKHDKRFFLQTREMKNIISRLIGNRRNNIEDTSFSKRKIDFYSDITEDIDSDEDGYNDL